MKGEDNNILKCKDLTVEWQFIFNIKSDVISIIIRAKKIISNTSRNYLNNTSGNHEIKALQKITILALPTLFGR